jgi:hypothetical protein
MRPVAKRLLSVSALVLAVIANGRAQDKPAATANTNDPRVGLKPGLHDAGTAARNMELLATLPKAPGFFDPKSPAGDPTPPENPAQSLGNISTTQPAAPAQATPAPPPAAGAPAAPAGRGGFPTNFLGFANSDIAFTGHHLVLGNFNGFNTYDIENAKKPHLVASVVCPGGQGDVSVYGNLLFMSVEQTRGRVDCGTEGVEQPSSPERFRGVRIFDMSGDKPKQIAAIQTCRGSHTHTLVTTPGDKANIYVYGSGTSSVRSNDELAGCSDKQPDEDPNTALFSIDVIQVPLGAPQNAKIVNKPRIFADMASGKIAGLEKGGDRGPGTQPSRPTNQCHDITVFPEVGLAAGACSGNGILLDISDPVHPVRLDAVADKNFAYWHSATFNNDGTKVIFTDEWGGGTRPRCRAIDPLNWGADAIFDIVDRKLKFGGYFKMPAAQTEQENCVAHNGSLIPVPGRDIMVQGWYQGGVSVFDFTDAANPVEIAFFDRGPIDAKNLITGGFWSAYWYNGHIYGSEIARGVDVFALKPSPFMTQNEIDAASLIRASEMNVQEQTRVTWPAVPVVARAYVDQLTRSKTMAADRLKSIKAAIDKADAAKTAKDKGAAAAVSALDSAAAELERDASGAAGGDAARLKGLAATLKGMASARR